MQGVPMTTKHGIAMNMVVRPTQQRLGTLDKHQVSVITFCAFTKPFILLGSGSQQRLHFQVTSGSTAAHDDHSQ